MKLRQYLDELKPEARRSFADRVGTTMDYFYQLTGGHRKPSVELVKRIESESGGKVTRYELRPDIYGDLPRDAA